LNFHHFDIGNEIGVLDANQCGWGRREKIFLLDIVNLMA
jgi:hypothetical protein